MTDLPNFDELDADENISDEQANELVVNAERFLTLIQTGGAEGLKAVTDDEGPALVSGGFAQIYLEAAGNERNDEEAGQFVYDLVPTEDEIEEYELTAEELDGIAQVRNTISSTISEDSGLPDAENVREQTHRTVDALLNEASKTSANPLNGDQRERLLNATYQEQIYFLAIIAALAEDRNDDG